MSNLLQKIEEHKKLFPLADLSGQLLKLEEELNEVNAAKNLKHKIEEINQMVKDYNIKLVSASEYDVDMESVVEDGETFVDNASYKNPLRLFLHVHHLA